jgi:hypothetical protein
MILESVGKPIIFPLLRAQAKQIEEGVGPLCPWLKTPPADGSYLYPNSFSLPRLPKPILFFLLKTKVWPVQFRNNPKQIPIAFTGSGVSRDSTGAVLGFCTCTLFKVKTGVLNNYGVGSTQYIQVAQTVSDVNGNYSFNVGADGPYRVVFDLAGSPNRAGLTLDTLSGI